ncbi:MAG: class I SAM-dependent methyltransferase [Cytophagales bacterium]|nr:class I SAM-dependent methyltransferase [Cytophagales bacterium]
MYKTEFPCPICGVNDIDVVCPDDIGNEKVTFNYDFSKKHNLTYRIVRCKKCTHCYASPRPKDIYKNYIDVVDEAYLANETQYLATFRKGLKKINDYIPSGRLLDVGCSTGIFLTAAKEFYQVEGIELSNWAASIARKKGFNIYKCKLGEMNMNSLYDIVTMWGVIEHFEYPDKEIKNISKLLREGGIVCLWTGDISSCPARLLGKKWWYYQGQHIQMFSKKSIIKLFEDNGFKLLNMSIYPYVMTMKSISKSLARYPLIHRFTKPILSSKFLSDKMITIKVPGEMFAIFKKK